MALVGGERAPRHRRRAAPSSQAINVFRDVTAERDADERRAFLLRAVDELSSSLDYEATLAAVARLAVPALADWCAVDIVDGDQLKRLATAHVDPGKVASVAELARRYPPNPTPGPACTRSFARASRS